MRTEDRAVKAHERVSIEVCGRYRAAREGKAVLRVWLEGTTEVTVRLEAGNVSTYMLDGTLCRHGYSNSVSGCNSPERISLAFRSSNNIKF